MLVLQHVTYETQFRCKELQAKKVSVDFFYSQNTGSMIYGICRVVQIALRLWIALRFRRNDSTFLRSNNSSGLMTISPSRN